MKPLSGHEPWLLAQVSQSTARQRDRSTYASGAQVTQFIGWQHAMRAFACRVTQRHQPQLTGVGAAGAVGFVLACVCLYSGVCHAHAYLLWVIASLCLLFGSLVVAAFGDPHELSRLAARRCRETGAGEAACDGGGASGSGDMTPS